MKGANKDFDIKAAYASQENPDLLTHASDVDAEGQMQRPQQLETIQVPADQMTEMRSMIAEGRYDEAGRIISNLI